ncbi:M28 family peptidase [Pseudoflavitalea sp. G-6-1-2]|uniref:M20/M25/M40 family metallo-hydrolase n=1 Tax=Pseudoflavitalea sp. G-6-1-2 TaxID=2728841 RepID=UPI00146F564D|nr:M20/M25/M40 family metallo-hydrolase [Pseudoflavitalea sp. G-6-1-2]NML20047.1 M28 family peptidase [Pseudoflavitalea sp. G-6-1-2]
MLTRALSVASLLLIVSQGTNAQRLKKADKAVIANLEAHISYLADDKLEGRRAGTNGEKLASEYISKQFELAGLNPKGSDKWLQPFEINEGRQVNPSTLFIINDHDLKLNTDFFPLAFSPNTSVDAAVTMALAEKDVPWFLDLKNMLEDNKENPHFDIEAAIKEKAIKMASKGATALVLYNTSSIKDNLKFNGKDRVAAAPIPVVYLTPKAMKDHLKDESASYDIKIRVDIGNKTRTGHNVIGYLDNGAPQTIVLGAHFDHLGYGEDGNSMVPNVKNQIHNGADDNASGTAALIELARLIKASKNKNNNYLFIAFSAEELGLNGSKYFTQNPTIDLKTVNYMINMDMVGRLNDSSKVLTVGGYGTSPVWGELFSGFTSKTTPLTFKFDSSGTGPSDHTSFYRMDIPVLFFFTGLHTDYHKPSDDFNKINYTGEFYVIKLIENLVTASNLKGRLAFTKTRETQTTTSARFSVTLGIMPDYSFSGSGVRVDGVSDNRPAQKAGLKAGDVITQLGAHSISSVEGYMQALSKFKKGESTTVKFNRGKESLEASVQF